jgi:hypothetical protein
MRSESALVPILELLASLVLAEDIGRDPLFHRAAHWLQTDTGVAIGGVDFNQNTRSTEHPDNLDGMIKTFSDHGYDTLLATCRRPLDVLTAEG